MTVTRPVGACDLNQIGRPRCNRCACAPDLHLHVSYSFPVNNITNMNVRPTSIEQMKSTVCDDVQRGPRCVPVPWSSPRPINPALGTHVSILDLAYGPKKKGKSVLDKLSSGPSSRWKTGNRDRCFCCRSISRLIRLDENLDDRTSWLRHHPALDIP